MAEKYAAKQYDEKVKELQTKSDKEIKGLKRQLDAKLRLIE